jgi:hypothetical protein
MWSSVSSGEKETCFKYSLLLKASCQHIYCHYPNKHMHFSVFYNITFGFIFCSFNKFNSQLYNLVILEVFAPKHSVQEDLSYIHQSLVAHWNKLSSCECKLLVGCGGDEEQTALERDRSSHPVATPGRVSHTFSLK